MAAPFGFLGTLRAVADLDDTLLGALLLGVIPALVVTLYFWLQYPKGREPTSKAMGLVFLGGMLCTLPVIPVELLVSALTARDGVAHVAEEAFLTAGLVEELAKYYVIRRFAMRHPVQEHGRCARGDAGQREDEHRDGKSGHRLGEAAEEAVGHLQQPGAGPLSPGAGVGKLAQHEG